MAQRYTQPAAQERMEHGLCPECGTLPEAHYSGTPEIWGMLVASCNLRADGVEDRINQYHEDKEAENGQGNLDA